MSLRAVLLEKYLLIPVMILLGKTVLNKSFMTKKFDSSFYSLALISAQL